MRPPFLPWLTPDISFCTPKRPTAAQQQSRIHLQVRVRRPFLQRARSQACLALGTPCSHDPRLLPGTSSAGTGGWPSANEATQTGGVGFSPNLQIWGLPGETPILGTHLRPRNPQLWGWGLEASLSRILKLKFKNHWSRKASKSDGPAQSQERAKPKQMFNRKLQTTVPEGGPGTSGGLR